MSFPDWEAFFVINQINKIQNLGKTIVKNVFLPQTSF